MFLLILKISKFTKKKKGRHRDVMIRSCGSGSWRGDNYKQTSVIDLGVCFSKDFFGVGKKSLLNLSQCCFCFLCFVFLATRHVES